MKFFTPELYLRFNSPDDAEADLADQAWEDAIRAYQRHLETIIDGMPSPVRSLTKMRLHDAELLVPNQHTGQFMPLPIESLGVGPLWSAAAVLSLKQDNNIVTLIYLLWDHLREFPQTEKWPFSRERKHWLYDELDAIPGQRGLFVHRVLFSDGSVMEIPFSSVLIHSSVLQPLESETVSRKSA